MFTVKPVSLATAPAQTSLFAVSMSLATSDVPRAVVQTFGINAMKRSGALHGSCGENCIPDFGRRFVFDAKLSEFELTFSDPVHQFNASYGN